MEITSNQYVRSNVFNTFKHNYNKENINFTSKPDMFVKSGVIENDKSNNNKLDFSECLKNFGKGLLSPITAIIKHPKATLGLVGATVVACTLVPVLGPLMAVGFGAVSAVQLGRGVYNFSKNCKNGNYDDAEKSFNEIGQGTIGVVTSALGIKQSAKIAKEAKLMNELKVNSLSQAQREAIALEVKRGSILDAVKETGSLFTTKGGWKAFTSQFKPSMIKTRLNEFTDIFKGKRFGTKEKEITYRKRVDQIEKFKKSPEGVRRAGLSDEEISAEVNAMFDKAFDKLGIPKEERPVLSIVTEAERKGGAYSKNTHTITFNRECYRSGVLEMDDTIMHEATHCQEAILRSKLPADRAAEVVKNELISRIMNGENEEILKCGSFIGPEMMTPPKMSDAMKLDFVELAKRELYVKGTPKNVTPELEGLLTKHPDFISQYSGREEALKILGDYSKSHNIRFNLFADNKISQLPASTTPLSAEEILNAEKSLVNEISTIEGNARISEFRLFVDNKEFNQYQFSPEEVLAETKGNEFLIENYTNKMNSLRESGNLSAEQETYMTGAIEKAKLVIEYRKKGLDYYSKYTEHINNPNDKELAMLISSLEKELTELKGRISPAEYEKVKEIINVPDLSKLDIASVLIPKSTPVIADIIADSKK